MKHSEFTYTGVNVSRKVRSILTAFCHINIFHYCQKKSFHLLFDAV
nr:MAG TPA: hypothetical protein [Bacteriophage sp.]DAN36658.1 MAG TPA: protein of unknown function DUF3458 [Caudoviricetes sp.]DAQ32927.1 MAG TPA: hypothetical protein [Caudoviricetes sp.]